MSNLCEWGLFIGENRRQKEREKCKLCRVGHSAKRTSRRSFGAVGRIISRAPSLPRQGTRPRRNLGEDLARANFFFPAHRLCREGCSVKTPTRRRNGAAQKFISRPTLCRVLCTDTLGKEGLILAPTKNNCARFLCRVAPDAILGKELGENGGKTE